ncbi:MAG: EamA family transporter [Verrucomicrobia bacterium]|nr:MAG: EamA family transporter [Verrucomicrobiota bacterium]
MNPAKVFLLTLTAMVAFASNSLLCRLALKQTGIDAASFTCIRIVSGAIVLWLIVKLRPAAAPVGASLTTSRKDRRPLQGNWPSAIALFTYAAAFSFAYISLPAGTGALLLFGAVQATMILWGLRKGERLHSLQIVGLLLAGAGLVVLLFPGLSAPPVGGSILMLGAGVAWGIYSLRGKRGGDPTAATAGNFVRAVPLAIALSIILLTSARLDRAGIEYAVVSGSITSGLGYVIWYSALPGLKAAGAATVQLSVPVLTAAGGILLLGENLTWRLLLAALLVLGGIALVVIDRQPTRPQ